jgi:hypothetical protein
MTRLSENRKISAIKVYRDLITPLRTDLNPDTLLAPSVIRTNKADAWDFPPDAEARSSSAATEIIDMTLCERYKCRRCK